jgi:nicotinamidase-related amidase
MENSALLVVDAQRIYTDPGAELYCDGSETTLANINRLIEAYKSRELPIVFVRHVHEADGSDLGRMFDYAGDVDDFTFTEGSDEVAYAVGLQLPAGAVELTKTRYSAFQRTNLEVILRSRGATRVVVCGFMTNLCCESTAREAHDRDFYVTFVPDATGCPDLADLTQDDIRRVVSVLLEAGFATVMTTEEVVAAVAG